MRTKLVSVVSPVLVALSFVVSRLSYIRANLHFDNTPPRYFYQFIDPVLLETRFWESIWYLHGQPPLLNFVTGLLYRRFDPESSIFQLLFLAMGLTFAFVLYWLGLRLGLKSWVSALLTIWFIVSPATVLYENLYFYTYPVTFILVLSVLVLSKFLESDNLGWGFVFFSLLASLCLTWAIFHLVWMLAVIALVAMFYRNWRKLVMASLIPVLIVAGWYTKNYLLFGTFSASSWIGMNLSRLTFLSPLTPQLVRDELVSQRELFPYPVADAFSPIESYNGLISIPSARGIPVLDEPFTSKKAVNYNHAFYMKLSKMMLRDDINFIRARPDLYLTTIKQSFFIYFHSSSEFQGFKNKPPQKLELWWSRIFYGQISSYNNDFNNRWKDNPIYVGWWLVIMYVLAVYYGLKLIVSHDKADRVFLAVVTFVTFTIVSVTLLVNFLELPETNRYRFTVDPLVLLLFGGLLQNAILKWVGR